MILILGLIISYLIGSIPTGYWFGRLYKKVDIRRYGSGNTGATNVFRVLGRGPGIFVLAFDIFKGFAAVSFLGDVSGLSEVIHRILLGVAVVSGHNWTIFLKFKGGKGIAAGLGILIGLALEIAVLRPVLGWTLLVWGCVFLASGYISLASITASMFLPFFMVLSAQLFELVVLGVILCAFVVLRHRTNIRRLLAGEENRVRIFRASGRG